MRQNDVKKDLNNLTRFRVRFSGATEEPFKKRGSSQKWTVLPDVWPKIKQNIPQNRELKTDRKTIGVKLKIG